MDKSHLKWTKSADKSQQQCMKTFNILYKLYFILEFSCHFNIMHTNQMLSQVTLYVCRISTDCATKTFFSSMVKFNMFFQVWFCFQDFWTVRAFMRSLYDLWCASVSLKDVIDSSTQLFQISVYFCFMYKSHMPLHLKFCSKRLSTNYTWKWFFSSMSSNMHSQVWFSWTNLVTNVTFKLLCVNFF